MRFLENMIFQFLENERYAGGQAGVGVRGLKPGGIKPQETCAYAVEGYSGSERYKPTTCTFEVCHMLV
jgi:hypothetical protein